MGYARVRGASINSQQVDHATRSSALQYCTVLYSTVPGTVLYSTVLLMSVFLPARPANPQYVTQNPNHKNMTLCQRMYTVQYSTVTAEAKEFPSIHHRFQRREAIPRLCEAIM
jgi:hypothetical protein